LHNSDDEKDLESESKSMETVFSLAYCTIAATSAKDSTQGFLRPRPERQYVKIVIPTDSTKGFPKPRPKRQYANASDPTKGLVRQLQEREKERVSEDRERLKYYRRVSNFLSRRHRVRGVHLRFYRISSAGARALREGHERLRYSALRLRSNR
jgi:hypothetical protein